MFFNDSHFSIFLGFDTHFHIFSPKSCPFGPQMAPNRLILGSQGHPWWSSGLPFCFFGPSWGSPSTHLGLSRSLLAQFILIQAAQEASQEVFFMIFQSFPVKKHKISDMKITYFLSINFLNPGAPRAFPEVFFMIC